MGELQLVMTHEDDSDGLLVGAVVHPDFEQVEDGMD